MRMKHFFLVLFFASTVCGTSFIGDFAPLKVGSVWKYSYIYSEESGGQVVKRDLLTIEIVLMSMQVNGNDTTILLNAKEQGRSISEGGQGFDTTGSALYIDTVIIADSIIKQPTGYKCKVFPFWKTHNVDSTNISIDGVTSYSTNSYPIYGEHNLQTDQIDVVTGYTYIQNVGLKSSVFSYGRYSGKHTTTINLISFNDKVTPLSIQNEYKCTQKPNRSYADKSKILTFPNSKITQPAFSLTGRKIFTGHRIPAGIIVSNGSGIVNKNR
jgi:hypothetical protein